MGEFLSLLNIPVLVWTVLLIIFIVGELGTVGLSSIWFAAGSLVALVATILGAGFLVQIFLFLAVSIILFSATRPWARKYINSRTQSTNADRLIGETIRISERVSNIDQTGMAVVYGQEWTVRTGDDNETIEAGQMATVVAISGVKLIVEK